MPPFTDSYADVELLRIDMNPKGAAGEYDIDYVAIEYYPGEDRFDFRLELGQGLGIYWALPASVNGPMWLAHVDGAAYTVDEPEVVADPWSADVDLTFDEDLGRLGGMDVLAVRVRMTANPMSYAFEIRASDGGKERVGALRWSAAAV